jgi:hypothetical protein
MTGPPLTCPVLRGRYLVKQVVVWRVCLDYGRREFDGVGFKTEDMALVAEKILNRLSRTHR